MNTRSKLILSGLCIGIAACSSVDVTKLRELKKSETNSCEIIAHVVRITDSGDERIAIRDAKKKVAKLGANSYSVDEIVPNGSIVKVNVSAYQCK